VSRKRIEEEENEEDTAGRWSGRRSEKRDDSFWGKADEKEGVREDRACGEHYLP